MKSNREIRAEALKLLGRGWFWRLLWVCIVLNLIAHSVNSFLTAAYAQYGIETYSAFLLRKLQMLQSGLDFTVPSMAAGLRMLGASCFQILVWYLFSAIAAYGYAAVALKSMRDERERWFRDSLGGFARPFEVLGLLILMNLFISLWSCLLIIPGLIAMYAYRQAWYLKTEHRDWSALKCIGESKRMMRGYKWQAFMLDCSYLGWLLLDLGLAILVYGVHAIAGSVWAPAGNFVSVIGGLAVFYFLVWIVVYLLVGRAVFYRELASVCSGNSSESLPS